jgi:hypothetical protein
MLEPFTDLWIVDIAKLFIADCQDTHFLPLLDIRAGYLAQSDGCCGGVGAFMGNTDRPGKYSELLSCLEGRTMQYNVRRPIFLAQYLDGFPAYCCNTAFQGFGDGFFGCHLTQDAGLLSIGILNFASGTNPLDEPFPDFGP